MFGEQTPRGNEEEQGAQWVVSAVTQVRQQRLGPAVELGKEMRPQVRCDDEIS